MRYPEEPRDTDVLLGRIQGGVRRAFHVRLSLQSTVHIFRKG